MAKYIPDAIIDLEVAAVTGSVNKLFICSDQPTTYTEASAAPATGYCLATIALVGGDFTAGDGDTSGRKITLAAQNGESVTTSGTATHYALGASGTSTLYLVGTISSQAIVVGNLINFPATDVLEIRDPA